MKLNMAVDSLVTVDGFSTCSISPGEVPALEHEPLDDPVEAAALVALGLGPGCECGKVLHCLRHNISKQSDFNRTSRITTDRDVEEDYIRNRILK